MFKLVFLFVVVFFQQSALPQKAAVNGELAGGGECAAGEVCHWLMNADSEAYVLCANGIFGIVINGDDSIKVTCSDNNTPPQKAAVNGELASGGECAADEVCQWLMNADSEVYLLCANGIFGIVINGDDSIKILCNNTPPQKAAVNKEKKMSNRKLIKKACEKNGFTIHDISYHRECVPVPEEMVPLGWVLRVDICSDRDFEDIVEIYGNVNDILSQIDNYAQMESQGA